MVEPAAQELDQLAKFIHTADVNIPLSFAEITMLLQGLHVVPDIIIKQLKIVVDAPKFSHPEQLNAIAFANQSLCICEGLINKLKTAVVKRAEEIKLVTNKEQLTTNDKDMMRVFADGRV